MPWNRTCGKHRREYTVIFVLWNIVRRCFPDFVRFCWESQAAKHIHAGHTDAEGRWSVFGQAFRQVREGKGVPILPLPVVSVFGGSICFVKSFGGSILWSVLSCCGTTGIIYSLIAWPGGVITRSVRLSSVRSHLWCRIVCKVTVDVPLIGYMRICSVCGSWVGWHADVFCATSDKLNAKPFSVMSGPPHASQGAPNGRQAIQLRLHGGAGARCRRTLPRVLVHVCTGVAGGKAYLRCMLPRCIVIPVGFCIAR